MVKTKDMPDDLPEKTHQEKRTKVKSDKTFGSNQVLADQEGLKRKKDNMPERDYNNFFKGTQFKEVIIFGFIYISIFIYILFYCASISCVQAVSK